jgi:hypothetical protein
MQAALAEWIRSDRQHKSVRPGASVPIADAFVAANSPYSRQFSASNILSVHGAVDGRADVVGFVARLNR